MARLAHWDVLALLHERGWIQDPRGKAKSVVFTELGQSLPSEAFARHFQLPKNG
jgi:hypothetical protein